ncbi:MAG: hypothetical protein WCK15_21790 [Pirellula sp.]
MITEESGTPGGWDDSHGWSKFFAGEGAVSLLTGGASKAASAVDDAGQCANWFAKFVNGGCFVAGTLVTLSDIPRSEASDDALWSDLAWQETPYLNPSTSLKTTATLTSLLDSPRRMLVPIEQVPIGARVPTKNPRPWEYDDSLPDPVQSEWGLISMTMVRDDGGIVDAELIRPWAWIRSHRIQAGKPLPMNIPELQVTGVAIVTSISECPTIAEGEGSVITARFLTRQVDVIARAEILGADGSIEVVEGTTIHTIWSLNRNDWVPLGELEFGEKLSGLSGIATVLSLTLLNRTIAVYNLEVHSEHVYQVGELAVLVHNSYLTDAMEAAGNVKPGSGWFGAHIFPEKGFPWADNVISVHRNNMKKWGLINAWEDGFWTDSGRHLGTHTSEYVKALLERFDSVSTREEAIQALDDMWARIQKYEWGSH